ncbi:MAG: DUF1192 domain-containing protein [Alphaproteobacteria bacterium]|nr:MAG: DUF1192 domain-containing protein [Alphaproteobacteria bacterium]
MEFDEQPHHTQTPLQQLAREDLEPFSVAALHQRITALKAEIKRVEGAIADKSSTRAAADALFKKR